MGLILQYFAALSAALGALSAGTALGWTSTLESKIKGGDYDFSVETIQFSWISSILNLGAACVCILMGILINAVGRKNAMLLILIPFSIGWGMLILAKSVIMLLIGRLFLGIACGCICVAGPVYTGEIAQKNIRGALGSFFQLLVTIGILVAYVLGSYLSAKKTSFICGIFPIFFGIGMLFCPESPTYLIMKGKKEKAIKSLKRFHGIDVVTEEIADLVKDEEVRKTLNFREAMKKKSSKKAMLISFGLMFFQQVSGINAVIFYTMTIFKGSNTDLKPETATIIVGALQVVATAIATLTLDRLGRRLLLLISDILMAICTLSLSVHFFMEESGSSTSWLPIASLCVFIIAFSLGFGPVPWLMMGEIFSTDIKGIAGSLTGTLNWFLAFLITVLYPPIQENIGASFSFLIFTGFSILGTFFVYFVVPETKGKSLSEIQEMLE
ncbi:unnamed protein product [Diamesa serratosioi]